jgi:hypothetical protein
MKRLLVLFVLALLVPVMAPAQSVNPSTTTVREPIGYEVITVGATAKGLTEAKIAPAADVKTSGAAMMAWVSIEGASLRVCLDGTTATASTCHLLLEGTSFTLFTTKALRQLSMYQGSGSVTVHVTYFR